MHHFCHKLIPFIGRFSKSPCFKIRSRGAGFTSHFPIRDASALFILRDFLLQIRSKKQASILFLRWLDHIGSMLTETSFEER